MGLLLWVVLVEEYSHFGKATKLHHLYVNYIIYIISVSYQPHILYLYMRVCELCIHVYMKLSAVVSSICYF